MIPIWTFDAIVGWVSRKFTKIFQGSDGNVAVDGRIDFKRPLDDSDRVIESSVFDLDRIRSEALNPQKSVETSSYVRATPRLWEQQRTLLFSALDGSQGPAGVEMPKKEDRQLIFGRLFDLLFDADDDWHLNGGITSPEGFDATFLRENNVIDWENLLSADSLLTQLQSEIVRVKDAIKAAEKAPVVTSGPASVVEEIAEAPMAEVAEEEAVEAPVDAPVAQAAEEPGAQPVEGASDEQN
jgi:hypothetical protein